MSRRLSWVTLLALVAFATTGSPSVARAEPLAVVVTSAADTLPPETPAQCPHESLCTLREAITVANAAATPDGTQITFSPVVFPPATPTPILIGETALPSVTAAGVSISGANAGVVLTTDAANVGLVLAGTQGSVRALVIEGFLDVCVEVTGSGAVVGGNSASGERNVIGGCGVGVAVRGEGALISGNAIGFADPLWTASTVGVGVAIEASNASLGDSNSGAGFANFIGHAGTAIKVGTGIPTDAEVTGAVISGNTIGFSPAIEAAPIVTGVLLVPNSNGTFVLANNITNANGTAIVVGADSEGISTIGNRLTSNRFGAIAGRAIDLAGDGIRNPNDPGDADTGPNEMVNHPTITAATQSAISGFGGHACIAPATPCSIQLYFAAHIPGSLDDPGVDPIPLGEISTDSFGNFVLNSPPVAAGQWLVALATDGDGNTSEFGPPSRVGAGAVACGNISFPVGWSHVGYFGAQPLQLGLTFPPATGGHVSSIHEFIDGTTSYKLWPEGTIIGRTLNTLVPPQPYWFNVRTPFTLTGGFAVTQPLPVQLKVGWNDFVYVGGTADVRDALSSITGKYTSVHQYTNVGGDQRWLSFGAFETPAWARDFTEMQSCKTYQVFVTEEVTLVPLQP